MTQMTLFPCFTVTVPPETGVPVRWPAGLAALPDDPDEVQAASAMHAAAITAALTERIVRRTMASPFGRFLRDYPRVPSRRDAITDCRVRQLVIVC
jgi:hypothetical protein